ncbi:MAG TPA: nitrilase-related carbon-nitrogen hydrolase, partial [Proteiniclasticum sp.]|nr:nitrilase-related carbon-nitrogen hydrolase [Proteiniclasticum sp.]
MDYIKISSVSPKLKVADVHYNKEEILKLIKQLAHDKVKVALFPELSLTSYTSSDMFFSEDLLNATESAMNEIVESTRNLDMVVILGLPMRHEGRLFNSAAVVFEGKILGMVPKQNLPNYNEFYESRWFTAYNRTHGHLTDFGDHKEIPFGNLVFSAGKYSFGVEICEDLFAAISPSSSLSLQGAEII